ncbi:MAG: carbamoyl phosphate synthase [Candidatus Eremiobacteraeota bacterium]|nr:carbamoyl phosphate synthase [Candidatus Eremiobacteraeota bacterium]
MRWACLPRCRRPDEDCCHRRHESGAERRRGRGNSRSADRTRRSARATRVATSIFVAPRRPRLRIHGVFTLKTLLVANRGEIALRVMRTAKEMGLAIVAVYSEADRASAHVAYADEAYLLGAASPAASYLNVDRLLETAVRSGADAIHPGYGFLAENASFARAVVAAGLTWVGPHADAIDAMGDKIRARQAMIAAGVPVVPGGTEAVATPAEALAAAKEYGLPLALKASGGGGGKGLKVARTIDEVESAFTTARREAEAYFKNPTIYAERYLENPKHVELQILADKHGTVVHVGERDCSLQRRHQKLYEETPALISERVRKALRHAGVRAAKAIGYDSVGTIETLVAGDDFFFLEMNTRIQVEHTISEMVSGLDLIREQLRVAAGEPLGYGQEAVEFRGHAIEVRVNAEDPAHGFAPAPGTIAAYREPAGFGVRVDSAAAAGTTIGAEYDSMIAKLIVWAPDRPQAQSRLRRAIADYRIEGVPTTLSFLRALNDAPAVRRGNYGTATLETFASGWRPTNGLAAAKQESNPAAPPDDDVMRVEVNDRLFRVRLLDRPAGVTGTARRSAPKPAGKARSGRTASGNDVVSPMHGAIVELQAAQGAAITEGQVVAVIEAMKMMNEVRAHRAGTVAKVHAAKGDTVEANAPIVTLE